MKTRVKVKRDDLIAELERRREQLRERVKREDDERPAAEERYRLRVAVELRKAADRIELGGALPETDYRQCVRVRVGMNRPSKETQLRSDLVKLERDLRVLRLGSDETIAVNGDDYGRWLT